MGMTLIQLLEQLGIELPRCETEFCSDELQEALLSPIEVHYQPNYPLKTAIENIRIMDGKVVIALQESDLGYGNKRAWRPEDED